MQRKGPTGNFSNHPQQFENDMSKKEKQEPKRFCVLEFTMFDMSNSAGCHY
jgi:hypothetical protein